MALPERQEAAGLTVLLPCGRTLVDSYVGLWRVNTGAFFSFLPLSSSSLACPHVHILFLSSQIYLFFLVVEPPGG